MKFGCCVSLFGEDVLTLAETGADYAEAGLADVASHSMEEVKERAALLADKGIACLSANGMFPGSIRLTGEDADHDAAARYLEDALDKAQMLGIRTVCFGSAGSRAVPEGFSTEKAREQLVSLGRDVIGPAFEARGMVCTLEPLNRLESNIVNSCAEGAQIVRQADRPAFRLLVDLYHFDMEHEPVDSLLDYRGLLAHAHIASARNGREFPRPGDGEDYAAFFRNLKAIGYPGNVSLEGKVTGDFKTCVRNSAAYLRQVAETV